MIEEEEMEKQIDDGTFDECAYVKDIRVICQRMMMIYVLYKLKLNRYNNNNS